MEKVSFNNKNSVFFNALRKKVNDYFQTNQIKPTGNIKLYFKSTTLASAVALYLILVFFTPTAWVSILLSALLGFNMAAIGFNIMHDGAHGAFQSVNG
jgi:linoleoyl-CoA desaturase